MIHSAKALLVAMSLMAGPALADDSHKDWVIIQSMSSLIFSSAQQAQGQIAQLGRTDTSSRAGRKASQLIVRGRVLQQQIMSNQDRPLPAQQLNILQTLIRDMDQAGAQAAGGSQGACFKSCDDAYGSGFGHGKGWNRFWCKASCFKINVHVGGKQPEHPIGSFKGGAEGTARPPASLRLTPDTAGPSRTAR